MQNLRTLRLTDMAASLEHLLAIAQKKQQGHLEFLAALLDVQVQGAQQRSLERRLKIANFPPYMTFDNFDWKFQPSLPIENLKNLKTLAFVALHQPVLILGKTGTGKTHLATALGIQACQSGCRVKFFKLQELLALLYATMADDTTSQTIAELARYDLIVIDHIGYIRGKIEHPSLLLDLICACQDRTSIIVTSSISIEGWSTVFGNPILTADIVDRLFHRAIIINIRNGRSYRSQGPHAPIHTKEK